MEGVTSLFSRCVIELERGIKACSKKDLVKQNGRLFPLLLLTISDPLFLFNGGEASLSGAQKCLRLQFH